MPEFYSNEEYVDMLLIYGEARRNAARAQRIYRERYPDRRTPHQRTFENVCRRLAETGSLTPRTYDSGGQRDVHLENRVLGLVADNPRLSTRRIATRTGASHSSVHRILQSHRMHPYHFQPVHGLRDADHANRVEFCEWLLQQSENDPAFLSKILFTDEATFTRNGILNLHNMHVWSDSNPHSIVECRHQGSFSINVWCGIIDNVLLGPYVLPVIDGTRYLEFLQGPLDEVLHNEVPLSVRRRMWFMHDGAPAHYSRAVRQYLNQIYGSRWIGRGGPIAWPPRSPDLNPLDFYLWGHLKDLVYSNLITSRE